MDKTRAGADSRFVRVCDFCPGMMAPEMRYTPLPHAVVQALFSPRRIAVYRRS